MEQFARSRHWPSLWSLFVSIYQHRSHELLRVDHLHSLRLRNLDDMATWAETFLKAAKHLHSVDLDNNAMVFLQLTKFALAEFPSLAKEVNRHHQSLQSADLPVTYSIYEAIKCLHEQNGFRSHSGRAGARHSASTSSTFTSSPAYVLPTSNHHSSSSSSSSSGQPFTAKRSGSPAFSRPWKSASPEDPARAAAAAPSTSNVFVMHAHDKYIDEDGDFEETPDEAIGRQLHNRTYANAVARGFSSGDADRIADRRVRQALEPDYDSTTDIARGLDYSSDEHSS